MGESWVEVAGSCEQRGGGSELAAMIERNARQSSDIVAFDDGREAVTHGAFRDRAHHAARALFAHGLRAQDRVAVLSMNSVPFAVLYGACELSGLILSSVNFRLAVPEIVTALTDSAPRIFLFEAQYADKVDAARGQLPGIGSYVVIDGPAPDWAIDFATFLAAADTDGAIQPSHAVPQDTAYLMFTSGTTGRPKGCMLGHAAIAAIARIMASSLGLTSSDRTLLMMPLFHIGAKAIALGQQWAGGTVLLHRQFDAEAILDTIGRERITVTHMAPTMIDVMVKAYDPARHDVSSLRTLLYAAAPMPPSVLRKALAIFGPVFEQMYGQTEGTGTLLPRRIHLPGPDGTPDPRLGSVGHAFTGCEVGILDDDDRELPPGAIGEIGLRGPTIMQGYWNNHVETVKALRNGWLHTGDMGRLDDGGYLYLVDRKKDMIVSGGENIYSREVEDALCDHPDVAEAAVIACPDERWGETVGAVIVSVAGTAPSLESLASHVVSRIASYKQPRRLYLIDALPLLANGKVDKKALRQRFVAE